MASVVTTSFTAEEAASRYLAANHPELAGEYRLGAIPLESGWLVEAVPTVGGPLEESRVLLVVNRHGFVEEIGATAVNRQHAQRSLATLRTVIQL